MAIARRAPNLFWRTFILLTFLIVFSVMGWLQSYRVLNEMPYAAASARQIVSMANLTRYALVTADPMYRPDLLMVLASREGLRVLEKLPGDVVTPLNDDYAYGSSIRQIEEMVRDQLGADTVLAGAVNGEPGLWVSISIDGDNYWLMTNMMLLNPPWGTTWFWWALAAFVASVLGAVLITSRLTAPLKQLSNIAREFGRGRMPLPLPEDSGPEELREVNSSFNRMVQDITRIEKDRELILAGVSHDLRTPITRLRLETELANLPEDTHQAMVSDLEQMETIVNQFMDYARKSSVPTTRVNMSEIVDAAVAAARLSIDPSVRLRLSIDPDLFVVAHPIELSRVVQNLCTNALRYGRDSEGMLDLFVELMLDKGMVQLRVADLGVGLDMRQAERLMRPFERGDTARGGTSGTGLGLAIVDRIVRNSAGSVTLESSVPHGLTVVVRIPEAKPEKKPETKKDA